MASLIDVALMTLNLEESKEVGALILEKAFVEGELSSEHAIETGIEHNTQIPFAGKISDSLKASTGCTPNAGTGVAFSEKVWSPKLYDTRWEHCAGDANKLFKLFQKAQRMNPDFYNRISSPEMGVIYSLIEQMLKDTLPNKIWFSDTAAADIAGLGVFKNGTDVDLYNVIDGLFKQIFADLNVVHVPITANAGATYALQALGTDAALGIFTAMVNGADSRLLEDGTAQILATRSLVDNYRNTLRTKTLGAGFIEIVEGGKPQLYFDGYKVVTKSQWDRTIKSVQDNGTTWNLPHRAIFTTPENIPVGTLSSDDFGKLDSFYDQYRKSNVIDVVFSLDAKHLESYMTVAAY